MLGEKRHRYIYLFGLILIGVSMPFSKFLMSVAQFVLALNWVLELDFKNKWQRLKNNYPALSIMGLFVVHLIWMLNAQDIDYGLRDLRIKLPLFILPLMIGSSKKLNVQEFKLILLFFLASITVSTAISGLVYFGFTDHTVSDYRDISIFISHIRLSLLSIMGVFITLYYAFKSSLYPKIIYLFLTFWLIFFLYILNSYSGLFILLFAVIFSLIRYAYKSDKKRYRAFASVFLVLILGLMIWQGISIYHHFFKFDDAIPQNQLERFTVNNNPYQHNSKLVHTENGHKVYMYICESELEKAWNQRSNIPYKGGKDSKGGSIRFTLLHYLTSLNYRKDSLGISKLTDEDIAMVEQGYPNYLFKNKYALYAKIYPIIKQLYEYQKTGYATGGTLVQRLEYLKVAKAIIKENFFWGTGTSNVKMAFDKKYASNISRLPKEQQFRAHNQFVTFFVSFGLVGFILSLFLMLYPFFRKGNFYTLSSVFFIVAFSSMLNEDTLETQAGVTFFIFFYIIFLVAYQRKSIASAFIKKK